MKVETRQTGTRQLSRLMRTFAGFGPTRHVAWFSHIGHYLKSLQLAKDQVNDGKQLPQSDKPGYGGATVN
jgi:hypothetical protein